MRFRSLGALLKQCRVRIEPERHSLGPHVRLPIRIGKAVSQQELAEAVGITREWYARMETERQVHVSASVLGAIADVLMMDVNERALLFSLAIPELQHASLCDTSTAILDAFGPLRVFTRRLWAATTETQALTIAQEYAITQLQADALGWAVRIGEGVWEYAATDVKDADSIGSLHATVRELWGPAAVDDLHCYTLLVQPGELTTRAERDLRLPDLAAKVNPIIRPDRRNSPVAIANVRSRRGLVAQLAAGHFRPHHFTELERAQLSTLADLTSLALS